MICWTLWRADVGISGRFSQTSQDMTLRKRAPTFVRHVGWAAILATGHRMKRCLLEKRTLIKPSDN
jgi:hypothetical protein